MTVSNTPGVKVKLSDKYFGMFLAYALDMFVPFYHWFQTNNIFICRYGLNPSMLMGLAVKESFFGALYATQDDGQLFLSDSQYDCYAPNKVKIVRNLKFSERAERIMHGRQQGRPLPSGDTSHVHGRLRFPAAILPRYLLLIPVHDIKRLISYL